MSEREEIEHLKRVCRLLGVAVLHANPPLLSHHSDEFRELADAVAALAPEPGSEVMKYDTATGELRIDKAE